MDLLDITRLLAPISPAEPAGSDVRYEPVFDNLQSEVEKTTSPVAAGTVKWEVVLDLASEILVHRSKDLVVTSYLAVALVHVRSADGVVQGLQLYAGMLERYWEDLYPAKNKVRGRSLSIEWWLEKMLRALETRRVSLSEAQSLLALELLQKIERLFDERFADAPSLTPLMAYFRERREKSADAESAHGAESISAPSSAASEGPGGGSLAVSHVAAVAAAKASEPAEPTVAAAVATHPQPNDVPETRQTEPGRAVEGAMDELRRAAILLRQEEPLHPLAFRLLRTSLWGALRSLPPNLEGRTRIAPPEPRLVKLLRELKEDTSPRALLDSAEAQLPNYIFWLDLNRLSFEALGLLGEHCSEAQKMVKKETVFLLERLPGVEGLTFSDGTPFADAETCQWLERARASVCCTEAPLGMSQRDGTGGEGGVIAQVREEAQQLLGEGKLIEALRSLNEKLQQCRSGKERLLWRLAMVQVLYGARAYRLALPQVEEVLAEVDHYRLESYDPELALAALKLAYRGFQSQAEPACKERSLRTLFRIGKLDPAEMVQVEKV